MNKKTLILVAATTVILASAALVGSTVAKAETGNSYSTLVQRIADTFHLNPTEVQKVVNDVHTEREVKMEQKFTDRLDQLVKDGKITSAQKEAIIVKTKELKSKREELKDMTKEERQAGLKKTHEDLKQWAKDNGIDEKYLLFRMHGGPGRGPFH